jgi:hypothetical protein
MLNRLGRVLIPKSAVGLADVFKGILETRVRDIGKSSLPRLAAPKQLPLDCLFFFEQIVALADDLLAARADFVSHLFGVSTNRGRADSHGAPAKAPLPGSHSQAILNLLPTQLQLACGKPCHFAVD